MSSTDLFGNDLTVSDSFGTPRSTTEAGATEGVNLLFPLPWAEGNYSETVEGVTRIYAGDEDGSLVAEVNSEQGDAAFICKAVNAHASLVAEVERLRGALSKVREINDADIDNEQVVDRLSRLQPTITAALRSGGE